jgi:hypothetical protein
MPQLPRPSGAGEVRFPDHRSVIVEDATRFRKLPPRERWQELFALREWGSRLTQSLPRAGAIRSVDNDAEAAWQSIQRELFLRHGG